LQDDALAGHVDDDVDRAQVDADLFLEHESSVPIQAPIPWQTKGPAPLGE
jgi:hypothetical protein